MSDWLAAVATIKHSYTLQPSELKQMTGLSAPVKRTASGTFGYGNVVVGSLPNKDECPHHSSKFLCLQCPNRFTSPLGCVIPTKAPEWRDCSANTCPSSNHPSSQGGTSETYPSSLPPSPSAHFLDVLDETR